MTTDTTTTRTVFTMSDVTVFKVPVTSRWLAARHRWAVSVGDTHLVDVFPDIGMHGVCGYAAYLPDGTEITLPHASVSASPTTTLRSAFNVVMAFAKHHALALANARPDAARSQPIDLGTHGGRIDAADIANGAIQELIARMDDAGSRPDPVQRATAAADALREVGLEIDHLEVVARASMGIAITVFDGKGNALLLTQDFDGLTYTGEGEDRNDFTESA